MYLCTRCEFDVITDLTTLTMRAQTTNDPNTAVLYCKDCNSNTDHLPVYDEIRAE